MEQREFIFDFTNPNFDKSDDHNRFFLQGTQNYFNELLVAKGYVFLNEVLRHLGIRETMAGQLVGWTPRMKQVKFERPVLSGNIRIEETQTRYAGTEVREYFLRINHEGLILFNVLGD
jgi:hypothetical protein